MLDQIYTQGMLGLGSGSYGADTEALLGDTKFMEYLKSQNLDTKRMSASDLSDRYKGFTTTPGMMDGIYNKIGGVFGGTGQDVKDIGGVLGDVAGFANMGYGMFNQNKMVNLAENQYRDQKEMVNKQWNEAMNDKAEFKAARAGATKAYYGQ